MKRKNYKFYQVLTYVKSKLGLFSLIFFLIGYLIFIGDTIWIKLFGILVSVPMLVFIFRRILFSDFAIGFSEEGIIYNTSLLGQIYIPWKSINRVVLVERKIYHVNHKYLCIEATDKKVLPDNQDYYHRIMLKIFSPAFTDSLTESESHSQSFISMSSP